MTKKPRRATARPKRKPRSEAGLRKAGRRAPATSNPPWAECVEIAGSTGEIAATLYRGDCRAVMAALDAESVHVVVTDPPYELGFMGKAWDKAGGVASAPETWAHCLRLLRPGGHLTAFAGSRTYHRIACAIEDAGFEIRDQLMWIYGSGFPKSHDIAKCIDKAGGGCGAARPAARFHATRRRRSCAAIGGPKKGRPSSMMLAAGMDGARR